MKFNNTAVVMGIALALFLGPRPVTAWTSGPEETPGPQEARNVWSWAKSAPANEHADLLKRAFEQAGLPAPLFPSPSEPFKAQVFTEGGTTNGGLPSFIPAPISNAKAIATRRYTLPGFSALPDHSYALWDWASGNETCPLDTVEGTEKDPAVACHTFSSHLGILNSTHFPPQSENTYRWYHELALQRGHECKILNDNFAASLNYADPDQRIRIDAMVKECEREALVIEAVGQHFLQDAWAMGHMWERWGTPFLSGFKNIDGNSPIAIVEERRARALAVALISGAIHGADSLLRKIPFVEGGDQMNFGRSRDVTWRQLPGDPLQGIGDIYADLLFSDSDMDYAIQSYRLLDCSASGVLEVYRKTAMVSGESTGHVTVNPVGAECFSQRATNLAIWEGLGLLKDPRVVSAINLVVYPITSISLKAWVTLSVETQIEMMKLAIYVGYRRLFLIGAPTGVDLANSGLVPPGDTFMQTGRNGLLTQDPPAPYADPRREANPSHLQYPDTHGRYIARVFNKAHVADWCIDNEADPKALRARVLSATPAERPAAYGACVEFTERHVRLGSMSSICEAATASSLPNSFMDTTGATDVKTAAERFCDCAGASAVALSGSALPAKAASYTFTDLGTLGGYPNSYAAAINDAGQVAGYAYISTMWSGTATVWNGTTATNLGALGTPLGGTSWATAINTAGQVAGRSYTNGVAIVWNGTIATYLGTLGVGGNSGAAAINDAGQVAGYAYTADHRYLATVWNGATATDLGTLGGTSSYAAAINTAGQVAGFAYTPGNAARHATMWNGIIATDLGTLGGTDSSAAAINDAGQVAGYAYTAGGVYHATVWNGTTATDLGTLGGTYSYATAINTAGQVVGWSDTAGGATHATVWNGATATDLNSFLDTSTVCAGWVLNEATGINDNGWIVGNASNSRLSISSHAFLLSVGPYPKPKPTP